jgi:hypothetical protein
MGRKCSCCGCCWAPVGKSQLCLQLIVLRSQGYGGKNRTVLNEGRAEFPLRSHGSSLGKAGEACVLQAQKITKLRGLSPQANYTDLATATCRPS